MFATNTKKYKPMPNDENLTTAHVQQNVMRRFVITDGLATCLYICQQIFIFMYLWLYKDANLQIYGCCFAFSYETVIVIVVAVDFASAAVTIWQAPRRW